MGFSAVRYASDKKHLEMLRLLLNNGADCNIISKVEAIVCMYVCTVTLYDLSVTKRKSFFSRGSLKTGSSSAIKILLFVSTYVCMYVCWVAMKIIRY